MAGATFNKLCSVNIVFNDQRIEIGKLRIEIQIRNDESETFAMGDCLTEKDSVIRIISARKATNAESRHYWR